MVRVLRRVDNQVRALRKSQVIEGLRRGDRDGVYWGIRSNIDDYGLPGALPAPFARTLELAEIATRLQGLSEDVQMRLINWGYALGDAGLRKHLDKDAAAASRLSRTRRQGCDPGAAGQAAAAAFGSLTRSAAPIAPPRSPSSAIMNGGGSSLENRCGIIAFSIFLR